MRLLITSGNSRFAQFLITALSQDHSLSANLTLRVIDTDFTAALPPHVDYQTGDLCDPDIAAAAVAGMDQILHLEPFTLAARSDIDEGTALDKATRGTYTLMNAACQAEIDRFILGSSLALFDRLPAHWRVNEVWRPRPEPTSAHLCPWLAELCVREVVRLSQMRAVCLRFGRLVDDADAAAHPFDSRWVHLEDAAQGVRQALTFNASQMRRAGRPDWFIFHITAAGPRAKIRQYPTQAEQSSTSAQAPFNYQPQHDFQPYWPETAATTDDRPWQVVLAPSSMPSPLIRKVVIFGAGGPMGSVTAQEMASDYVLRLADIRPLADIAAEAKDQDRPRPIPPLLDSPHENQVVDIRDPAQVMAACEGMDAIINCSVQRRDPVNAFLVSTIGAYNIVRAAIAHNIRRVVQTGPLLHMDAGYGSHVWDYDVPVDAPPRPLENLYHHTKYLGQEICRVYAEHYGLEVPVLLFWRLVYPDQFYQVPPFVVSWADTGRALRRAIEVPSLPSPYETFTISVDLPHGRFRHEKAKTVLGWQPQDDLAHFWQD